MNPVLGLVIFALVALVAFFVLRSVIKVQLPNLGRIGSGAILAAGTLLDQLNVLPWGTILSDAEAKMTGFAIMAGMAILHVIDTVKATPPAPPAA